MTDTSGCLVAPPGGRKCIQVKFHFTLGPASKGVANLTQEVRILGTEAATIPS